MIPRECWETVLSGRQPDRTPMDYCVTPGVTSNLTQYLGCGSGEETFGRLRIDSACCLSRVLSACCCREHRCVRLSREGIDLDAGVYTEVIDCPLMDFSPTEEIEDHCPWPDLD